MANAKNLIPNSERTPEQLREMASAGGKASGAARRRKRSLREAADVYLSLPVSDRQRWNRIASCGVDPEDVDDEKTLPLLFRLLPKEQAAEVFVELESDQQELLIRGFSNTELKEVLDELYLDDTVDIVEEMPANVVKRILKHSDPDIRKSINEILKYPEDSTGSIMTTEYVDLKATMTVEDALKRILNTELPRRTGCPILPISQRNVEALRYFMDNGGRFAVATGRALPAFRIFAEQVPMNAPAVVCNGGALYDFKTERYLETMELPETIRPQGQDVLDRFPTAAVEAYHMDNVIHAVRPNEYTRQHEHVTHAGVQPVPTLLEVPMPLIKIMFEDDHEHLLALRDYVSGQPWSANYEVFFSDRTLLEVTRKGASKGAMVARLAKRLGISMDHVYCAGDENNDLSMLTMAAEGFAPANCVETVRSCGATIVADCDHDTLAEIVSILDKRY